MRKEKRPRGRSPSLLRRCYPVHKYPTRRENKNSRQSIPDFLQGKHPYPTQSLRRILKLIIQENSFEFSSKNYLQTYEMRWVQRWQLPLPTSFCRRSRQKYRTSAKLNLLSGKDRLTIFFSLWRTERKEIDEFLALASRHHPFIKFTAKNI